MFGVTFSPSTHVRGAGGPDTLPYYCHGHSTRASKVPKAHEWCKTQPASFSLSSSS